MTTHRHRPLRGRHAERPTTVPLIVLPPAWVAEAACGGTDPELFFPEPDDPDAATKTARAAEICASCPVAAACAVDADTTRQRHGIWGGRARTAAPARRRNGGEPVDPDYDNTVMALRAEGMPIAAIADRLGRSPLDIERTVNRVQQRVRRARRLEAA